MIQRTGGGARPGAPAPTEPDPAAPWWNSPESLATRLAFVTIWTTGGDVRRDGVFRIQAWRTTPNAAPELFDRYCDPFAGISGTGEDATRSASQRMVREFGVRRAELAEAAPLDVAWKALHSFLQDRPIVVLDRAEFDAWDKHLGSGPSGVRLGLGELLHLFAPGPGCHDPAVWVRELLPEAPSAPRAIGAESLLHAAAAGVDRFLNHAPAIVALACAGYGQAFRQLKREAPERAARLALAFTLCQAPEVWSAGAGLFTQPTTTQRLQQATSDFPTIASALRVCEPRWAAEVRAWADVTPLPPTAPETQPLSDEDRGRIEDAFEVHLPRHFGGGDGASSYRAGQHAVAREIAEHLSTPECLLMHAPTGTGKTLAYLVPLLLWSARNELRTGVATYTRALQEQAMEHDVPLALRVLSIVDPQLRVRVALLKGRANYLCWRSLTQHVPEPTDSGDDSLAWTSLALFALRDTDGDLDRFPRSSPVGAASDRKTFGRLIAQVRAESECCSSNRDRQSCGADAARRRAERAHVVITNHALVLARPDFLSHLVFDECEHLHEVAHNAFSHTISFKEALELLERLIRETPRRRTPLGDVTRASSSDSIAGRAARRAMEDVEDGVVALERLHSAARTFLAWRTDELATRPSKDNHFLFREYAESDQGQELGAAHAELRGCVDRLEVSLATISEQIEEVPLRSKPRVRRVLARQRAELSDLADGLRAWLPWADGRVLFARHTYYDIERDNRGQERLAARVLLPHEFLGRFTYPKLASSVLISATTFLRGSFDATGGYLGVQRAAEPAPDEDREPLPVRTFLAPDAFDYARVMVSVPKDAPSLRGNKETFLRYTEEFIAHLTERTRGRCLVLFTNADDCKRVGQALQPRFAERRLPLFYQRMEDTAKEELADRFRASDDATLLGLDTFWFGADFPGETLEYLVIVRVPYGVPDGYHNAQCAAMGGSAQRSWIYLPRALAKFRQGFGRLMRKETDRGCVFLLDARVLDPRHRIFLKELPLKNELLGEENGARLVQGDTDHCIRESLTHMGMLADVSRRNLDTPFRHPVDHRRMPQDISPFREDTSLTPFPPRSEQERVRPNPDELPF